MKKFVFIVCFWLVGLSVKAPVVSLDYLAETVLIYCRSTDFTFESFKCFVFANCKQPEYVISQAILETGNFTSKAFKEHNNLFGMKKNKRGYIIENRHELYASYSHWSHSVLDYAQWQRERYKGGDYLNFLDSIPIGKRYYRYAQDPKYRSKLIAILEKWD